MPYRQLACTLQPARDLRDGLERSVEDLQRLNGDFAHRVRALGLELDQLQTLEDDALREQVAGHARRRLARLVQLLHDALDCVLGGRGPGAELVSPLAV